MKCFTAFECIRILNPVTLHMTVTFKIMSKKQNNSDSRILHGNKIMLL